MPTADVRVNSFRGCRQPAHRSDPRLEQQIRRQLSAYGLGIIIGVGIIVAMALYSVLNAFLGR